MMSMAVNFIATSSDKSSLSVIVPLAMSTIADLRPKKAFRFDCSIELVLSSRVVCVYTANFTESCL